MVKKKSKRKTPRIKKWLYVEDIQGTSDSIIAEDTDGNLYTGDLDEDENIERHTLHLTKVKITWCMGKRKPREEEDEDDTPPPPQLPNISLPEKIGNDPFRHFREVFKKLDS